MALRLVYAHDSAALAAGKGVAGPAVLFELVHVVVVARLLSMRGAEVVLQVTHLNGSNCTTYNPERPIDV